MDVRTAFRVVGSDVHWDRALSDDLRFKLTITLEQAATIFTAYTEPCCACGDS